MSEAARVQVLSFGSRTGSIVEKVNSQIKKRPDQGKIIVVQPNYVEAAMDCLRKEMNPNLVSSIRVINNLRIVIDFLGMNLGAVSVYPSQEGTKEIVADLREMHINVVRIGFYENGILAEEVW